MYFIDLRTLGNKNDLAVSVNLLKAFWYNQCFTVIYNITVQNEKMEIDEVLLNEEHVCKDIIQALFKYYYFTNYFVLQSFWYKTVKSAIIIFSGQYSANTCYSFTKQQIQ